MLIPIAILRIDRINLRHTEVARDTIGFHHLSIHLGRNTRPFGQDENGVERRAVHVVEKRERDAVVLHNRLSAEERFVGLQPFALHADNVAFCIERLVFDTRSKRGQTQGQTA